jgi:hypothetical protein
VCGPEFLRCCDRFYFRYVGEWLSLVEHLVRDQGVGGSNPLSPTNYLNPCYSAGYEHTHISVSNSCLGSLRVEENGVMPCAFTQTQPQVFSHNVPVHVQVHLA